MAKKAAQFSNIIVSSFSFIMYITGFFEEWEKERLSGFYNAIRKQGVSGFIKDRIAALGTIEKRLRT